MKFLLLTLLLTVGANSAYAITCNSVDSPNKFDIENHGFGKYTAKVYIRAISHVFAGSVESVDLFTDEYSFYDQNGDFAKFTLKKKIYDFPSQHCHYRHGCGHSRVPATIKFPKNEDSYTGKLEIEGLDSEYFNCF